MQTLVHVFAVCGVYVGVFVAALSINLHTFMDTPVDLPDLPTTRFTMPLELRYLWERAAAQDLRTARLVTAIRYSEDGLMAYRLGMVPHGAPTEIHITSVYRDYPIESETPGSTLLCTLIHELAHVRQFAEMPKLRGAWREYALEILPTMERDAEHAETRYSTRCAR